MSRNYHVIISYHAIVLIAITAISLAGCAQQTEPPVPAVVSKEYGCRVFRPYTRGIGHLDKEDKVWIAGHQAAGRRWCGSKWLGKGKPIS